MNVEPDQLKAILFDMDGTLVSSLPIIHHCVNLISRKYANRTLTVEQVISSFGPPAHEIIRRIIGSKDELVQEKGIAEYYDCYNSNVAEKAILFSGIPRLLLKIRESGRHLAVVTGVEKILMDYTLDAFDLSKFFEIKVSRDDVTLGKPDPEGVRLALARLSMKGNETLLVGDAPADILAARRAGVYSAAALWGPENIGDPRSEYPDLEFTTIQQLEQFLFRQS